MLTCGEAEDAKENKEKEKQPGVHVVDDKRMVEHWGDARWRSIQGEEGRGGEGGGGIPTMCIVYLSTV